MSRHLTRQRNSPRGRRIGASGLERLEQRQVLSVSSFEPPTFEATATNPVQEVRVVVLNFEPTVPSHDNRKLWEVFGWNDPRELSEGFIADVESASGGAIDYQIVDWRDLNEFPIFTDGFRYTADQYVSNRSTNSGWHDGVADFYAIAEQQGLAELVNSGAVDEIWMFGDHFFNLLGEAWMAGPQSFFVNGPSFPDFAVDHAVAGFGFNYERGVAEMVHNLGHRTENHLSRAYGGWNIANPQTPWDYFTANVAQSNTTSYGVGSVHFPFNGASDYDYANTRTFATYADDFVENFPAQTYAAVVDGRDAWGDYGVGDWQRGYLSWFFGHVPRSDGDASDGRENNWYKYIYDFNSYRPGTGAERDNEAILGATPLTKAGGAGYEFTVRYYDTTAVDAATLDGADLIVTGPNGYSQLATLVSLAAPDDTTAGTARTARYRVSAPGGAWDAADAGLYSVALRAGQVRDTTGNAYAAATLGQFRVDITDGSRLDVGAMLTSGEATVTATTWDIGAPALLFDDNVTSLYRTANIDPAVVTLAFETPQSVEGFRVYLSHASGNPSSLWRVEAADTLADLDSRTGSYLELVPWTGAPSDQYSAVDLPAAVTASYLRLSVNRLFGDDYVHVNEWQLVTSAPPDTASPEAVLASLGVTPSTGQVQQLVVVYSDDTAVDVASINYGDIVVTGPDGSTRVAALGALDANANGPSREVRYFYTAPGGAWGPEDNGVYTVTAVAGQVLDTSGRGIAGGVLGTFTIDLPEAERRPLADMTEGNASSWQGWAQSATIASTYNDTSRKLLGQSSVRFETNGGFDTSLRYAPPAGVLWDLADASEFHFSLYAENPSAFGFQFSPLIVLTDADGAKREFRYFRDGSLHVLWNEAIGSWLDVSLPIKSVDLPSTGWRAIGPGNFDFGRVTSVEVHADTWDAGFTLWLDRAGFDLPVKVTSAWSQPTLEGGRLTVDLDAPDLQVVLGSQGLAITPVDISGANPLSAADVALRMTPSAAGGTRLEATLPGALDPTKSLGVYLLTIPAGSVRDVAGNTLAEAFSLVFSTVPGDYNADFAVDELDHAFWSARYGATEGAALAADGNGDGVVDAADYTVWRDNRGFLPVATAVAPVAPSSGEEVQTSTPTASSSDSIADHPYAAYDAALAVYSPRVVIPSGYRGQPPARPPVRTAPPRDILFRDVLVKAPVDSPAVTILNERTVNRQIDAIESIAEGYRGVR